jgi:hypothetical protein
LEIFHRHTKHVLAHKFKGNFIQRTGGKCTSVKYCY